MGDYVAQHRLNMPGSYAMGYGPGDPVSAQVVADWGLNVPDDVVPADGYVAPRPADDSDDRAAWEAYVISKGAKPENARAASLDDLRGMYEPDPEPERPAHDLPAPVAPEGVDGAGVQNATPVDRDNLPAVPDDSDVAEATDRPATSARKADWVEYVVASGGDEQWARNPDTTKDDLIAWKPDGS